VKECATVQPVDTMEPAQTAAVTTFPLVGSQMVIARNSYLLQVGQTTWNVHGHRTNDVWRMSGDFFSYDITDHVQAAAYSPNN